MAPRAEKRLAVTRAARVVFGRDGYARSSIDAIAGEAGVSTRTIYNHFESKEQLFNTVLTESATQVADAFIERVSAFADDDLGALGHAVAGQALSFPEHFAMVRQITAEGAHFPRAVLEAWRQVGPLRVENEVARRLAANTTLQVGDANRAARHFIAVTTAEITSGSFFRTAPLTEAQVAEIIAAGVEAFLNGYTNRSTE
jgi:AcrR family transcriptional regulator